MELLSCHSPILSPVHASIAVLTVKPSLGILRMQTRGGALLSIAKGPGPRNPHPGPMSCGPPVPNLVESTSSPRVSPNLTGPPSKPRQHPANNTSLFTPPRPHKRTPIDYRLAQTTTYSPALLLYVAPRCCKGSDMGRSFNIPAFQISTFNTQ